MRNGLFSSVSDCDFSRHLRTGVNAQPLVNKWLTFRRLWVKPPVGPVRFVEFVAEIVIYLSAMAKGGDVSGFDLLILLFGAGIIFLKLEKFLLKKCLPDRSLYCIVTCGA